MEIEFYGQKVQCEEGMCHTHIHKPIWGTCIALNAKLLKAAAKEGVQLHITCGGGGDEVVDPKQFMKTAKQFEKVFKDPKRPMVLYKKELMIG